MSINVALQVAPQKKNSQANKSGDLTGQEMYPSLDMTSLLNNWFMALIEFLAICEITPSC
jgi:hypothetical protein